MATTTPKTEDSLRPLYSQRLDYGGLVNQGNLTDIMKVMGLDDLLTDGGATVLDLGCGTGHLSHFLSHMGNWVTGVDYCVERLNIALAGESRAGFVCSKIQDYLDECPVIADFSLFLDVLEHLEDPVAVIKMAQEVTMERVAAAVPLDHPADTHIHVFAGRDDVIRKLNPTGVLGTMNLGDRVWQIIDWPGFATP